MAKCSAAFPSDNADIKAAFDAAHAAKDKWAEWAAVNPAEMANILNRIAQRVQKETGGAHGVLVTAVSRKAFEQAVGMVVVAEPW
jgi:acyl-CoA reductase-like NAD-dependent aldehyde dehydrogenase